MPVKVEYTTEQTYTPPSVSETPSDLQRVPGTNIDIQPENDKWSASVQGVDGSGNVVQLVPTGGTPTTRLEVTGTMAQLASGFSAAAVAGGGDLTEELDKAIIAHAKTMLPK